MSKQTDLNRTANTVRNALLKNNIVYALDSLRRVPQDVALEVLAVAVDGVEPTKRGRLLQALGFSGDDDMDVFDVLGAEPSVCTEDMDFL
jgi:hypothetical protein